MINRFRDLLFVADDRGGGLLTWPELAPTPGTVFHVIVREKHADGDRELFRDEVEDNRVDWETLPWSSEAEHVEIEVEQEIEFVPGPRKRAVYELSKRSG